MAGTSPDINEDRIAEEAAGWVARLQSSDATERDRRDFLAWMNLSPANRAAYDELKGLWSELKDVPLEPKAKKAGLSRRTAIGNVIAIGFIALLATLAYQMGFVDRLRADHYTSVGQVSRFTLEDGTWVDLNTDSAIAVRYSAAERRIELLRGEAFFDVAKNPNRPFVVEDGTLSATALGTRFAVRVASGTLPGDVQVEEGRVEVAHLGERVILGAGDVARVTSKGSLSVSRTDVPNETAWRDGKLVFSGQPLKEVLATLGRYRHGQIVILDEAAANRKVSGIFDLADTDQALAVLEQNLPVTITHLTGMMVLVSSR
ncbi:FecR family protein [Aquabacter sp. CN5-332]|uniref:FecR family protein n=1 Tax=Aquabacter sp. CN5-332 TaxID=3156608 RepID=UPI0032B3374A